MKKVLIVDDAAFMRLTIKELLGKIGSIEFVEAQNGIEAVSKYMEIKPDVVTMDITMPDMTGLEALKLIRKADPKAKVVMVSAMGQEPMVKEAVLNGARTFIVKPFKEEHVIGTIKKLLEI
ncbi:MAG: response regulator [Clostridiales bacterium]|nr:response regulator [Clostridiales bacterium]